MASRPRILPRERHGILTRRSAPVTSAIDRPDHRLTPSRVLGEQAEPGRQGVAEGLALLGGFEFVEFADGSDRVLFRPEASSRASASSRRALVQVPRAVAGDPGELDDREDRVGRLSTFGRGPLEQGSEPARRFLDRDHRVGRSIERHPGTDPAQAPERVRGDWGDPGPSPGRRPTAPSRIRVQPFERGGAPPDLGQLVGLGPGPGRASWRHSSPLGREQERGEPAMNLLVMGPDEAGGDPPPEHPPIGPALQVPAVLDPLVEHRPEGLDPVLVERESGPGSEAEPGQVEPARFVPRPFQAELERIADRLPEGPKGRRGPGLPRSIEESLPAVLSSRLGPPSSALAGLAKAPIGSPRRRRRPRIARSRRRRPRLADDGPSRG